MANPVTAAELLEYLDDTHTRTLRLVTDLGPDQMLGPRLPTVNPPNWEIGHLAWFNEYWVLRNLDRRAPLMPEADTLYDSSAIAHDRRWDLPLPRVVDTLAYLQAVNDALRQRLHDHGDSVPERDAYFYLLAIFHQDMHSEAFTYMRQTLGYPAPAETAALATSAGPLPGDVEVPGGRFLLGATSTEGFVFDNEKWAHPVELAPFRIARAPVTNADYVAFVDDHGYRRREFWDDCGWEWRARAGAEAPRYWRRNGPDWEVRRFDRWTTLAPHAPVMHVNWHEAQAWCRWAGRRLPSEAEWEAAAACEVMPGGIKGARKRRYPWGDETPTGTHANLHGGTLAGIDVAALPQSDSACGCRQMIGNIWEWTASTFAPYPGFSPDPYRDYSAPWFGTHKVLRGGSWATPARLVWNTWRNFYTPDRNDIFAGFRSCAR